MDACAFVVEAVCDLGWLGKVQARGAYPVVGVDVVDLDALDNLVCGPPSGSLLEDCILKAP